MKNGDRSSFIDNKMKLEAATSHNAALERLRAALLTLPATAENGFEGMIAALLSAVCKISFRLADGGRQGGEDGRGESICGTISFEAKRYDKPPTTATLLNKAAEVKNGPYPPDLWIVAATAAVGTQTIEALKKELAGTEVTFLLLDWPNNDKLPPLALLCAMEAVATHDFFLKYPPSPDTAEQVLNALKIIADHGDFDIRSSELRAQLTHPDLAAPLAKAANYEKFKTLFSDLRTAKSEWGQPLSPAHHFPLATQDRENRLPLDEVFTLAPTNELVVVQGDEGCGKSWSVAQGWLAQDLPPFLLFLDATRAEHALNKELSLPSLLAHFLTEQSDVKVDVDTSKKRWERRLDAWIRTPTTTPRLVLVIDGLNERPNADWISWLPRLTDTVARIGGRFVVTARSRYFERLEKRLKDRVSLREITISRFSDTELDAALQQSGINPTTLKRNVRKSLRNPRLLGIALELLSEKQLRSLEEISVERLLFEHLKRHQAPDPTGLEAEDFSQHLVNHAKEIIKRIKNNITDDRLLFGRDNTPNEVLQRLLPVTEEKFFISCPDDHTLYQLSEDGLVYALAIAVIHDLKKAKRNHRPVHEHLARRIEPFAALDKVSDVLFAALSIGSSEGEGSPQEIGAALFITYLCQQNIDDNQYEALRAVVRILPEAALDALYAIDTSDDYTSHKDWLVCALREVAHDPLTPADIRATIESRVNYWLRLYSRTLLPSVVLPKSDASERAKARQEAQEKFEAGFNNLTACERAILDEKMHRRDGVEIDILSQNAFFIIAGLPLQPFAESLMCWSLGRSLNSGYHTPDREYTFLIQHNYHDWRETRNALRAAGECLARPDASRSAQWALVRILRATGDAGDASRAEELVDTLMKDWQRFNNDDYVHPCCATDPCDPQSVRADNIDQTAERYKAIPLSDLKSMPGMTTQDLFFRRAAPSLARFFPEAGVQLYRTFVPDLLQRPGEILGLSLPWLKTIIILLEPSTVKTMLARAISLCNEDAGKNIHEGGDWRGQYLLACTFAHLNGDEQLSALRDLQAHDSPLLNIRAAFKPASAKAMEITLDQAIQSNNSNRLQMALAFAHATNTPLSNAALAHIRPLINHEDTGVRWLAMDLSAQYPDRAQLEHFVASGWSAHALDPRNYDREGQSGSLLLFAAATEGLISAPDALARLHPGYYGQAVQQLGNEATGPLLAHLLREALSKIGAADLPAIPFSVVKNISEDGLSLFTIDDEPETLSLEDSLKRWSESPEDWTRRHRQRIEQFLDFTEALRKEGAELILEYIGPTTLHAITASNAQALHLIADAILALPSGKQACVASLAAQIARALSARDAEKSVALLRCFESRRVQITIVHHYAGLPLIAREAWHCTSSPAIQTYWQERLNKPANDHDIAMEVLAACQGGQQSFVEEYAQDALDTGHPAMRARALMIFGYLDRSPLAESTLAHFQQAEGLIGKAAETAQAAYERNIWSRVWFEKLTAAQNPVDFWRYSVLLTKIVDGRFALWIEAYERQELFRTFKWTLDEPIKARIEKWKKKRSDKLFGGHKPDAVYLDNRTSVHTRIKG